MAWWSMSLRKVSSRTGFSPLVSRDATTHTTAS